MKREYRGLATLPSLPAGAALTKSTTLSAIAPNVSYSTLRWRNQDLSRIVGAAGVLPRLDSVGRYGRLDAIPQRGGGVGEPKVYVAMLG